MLLLPWLMLATRQPPPRVVQAVVSSLPCLLCPPSPPLPASLLAPRPSRRTLSSGGRLLNPRKRGVFTRLWRGEGVVQCRTAMERFPPWGQFYWRQGGRLTAFQGCSRPPGKQLAPLAAPCAGRLVQVCVRSTAAPYGLEMILSLQLKERQSALEGN